MKFPSLCLKHSAAITTAPLLLLSLLVVVVVSSFSIQRHHHHHHRSSSFLRSRSPPSPLLLLAAAASPVAVVTGPRGTAASSREEDLRLTLQIILDHEARSATASREQFLWQMASSEEASAPGGEPIDVSVPYDAAARLAYDAASAGGAAAADYEAFRVQYEADAVERVKARKRARDLEREQATAAAAAAAAPPPAAAEPAADVSVPYDAAARLAYGASDGAVDYAAFRLQYEARAVAEVRAKRRPPAAAPVVDAAPGAGAAAECDVRVPYDAAARLAYERMASPDLDYAAFQRQYEEDAIAQVIAAKQRRQRRS